MVSQSPRDSVLMPICDVANTLAENFSSIAYQTYHDFEFVVVDDELAKYRGLPILAAVGNWGARELIPEALNEMNSVEAKDYCCIA